MKTESYEKHFKRYYEEHRALGWYSTVTFGPPELVEAVKRFVKDYKRKHDMYQRPVWIDKKHKPMGGARRA